MHTEFSWRNLFESGHLEGQERDGEVNVSVWNWNWTELFQDGFHWRVLVSAVLNFELHYYRATFLTFI